MTTRPPEPVQPAPRKRGRKLYLFFALLGVLLGVLVVLFLSRIYNPFEEGIGDQQLLLLAPADADALVFIPRVPMFLGELRDRPFSKALADNRGFQRFLRSEWARDTGAVEALSSAFGQLDLLRAQPPLGLDLFKDISGEALVFAGYAPTAQVSSGTIHSGSPPPDYPVRPGATPPWQFIAMFRPNSWKVLAAVNVLIDPVLGDLGPIKSGLEKSGVKKVERFRDSVTLSFERGPSLSVTRIRNVVVIGTEVERISRMKTTIERDRLPSAPPVRYAELAPELGASPYEVRAVARRRVVDSQLHLTERLDQKWGRDNVALLESALPRFGGEDLLLVLSVDEAFDLRLRMLEAAPRNYDLARSYRRFSREDMALAFQQCAPLLPDSTFAFSYLRVDVAQFLEAFFNRPEIFTSADLGNLADVLKSVEQIQNLQGLKDRLAAICDGNAAIGFFKQERLPLDKAAAGAFVAWHLQDEPQLRSLLASISAAIRERSQAGSSSAVRDLVHREKGGTDLYEIVLPAGVVDDPRVTNLGLVIGRGMLIITNFIPSFRPLMQAGTLDGRTLPAEATLASMLDRGPDSMRVGGAIGGDAIYQYFDQAAEGWAVQQTTPSARLETQWNSQAETEAQGKGLRQGTAEYKQFVDDSYQRELDKLIKIERPRVRRDIDLYLGYLRGVFRSIGFFISEHDGVEMEVRLDPAAPGT